MKIPPFQYSFTNQDIDDITASIRSILQNQEYLTMGKYGEEFEEKFSQFNSSKYALATNSGTSALEMILSSLDLKDKEILVPTNTFTATVIPILNVGATPVFVDCADDMCLCPIDMKRKYTRKTGAVLTVHIGGYISPHIYEIQQFCRENNIFLVEDAAHAQGSTLDGKKAGHFGIAAAFSFFSTKVITTGEGGMVVTEDEKLFQTVVPKRNHGQVRDNYVDVLGNNWRMHEFMAVLGLSQIKRINEIITKRREIAKQYDLFLKEAKKVKRIQGDTRVHGNYYKYILQIDPTMKQSVLQNELKKKYDITMGGYVYPLPCHKQKVFKEYVKEPLPKAERLCNTHICPPIYPDMSEKEVEYVATSLLKVAGER